jgi:hypothetical protein
VAVDQRGPAHFEGGDRNGADERPASALLNPLADAERRQDAADPVDTPAAVERARRGHPANGSGERSYPRSRSEESTVPRRSSRSPIS